MAIGRVERSDGTTASGFLCEPAALDDAEDITSYGGWRVAGGGRTGIGAARAAEGPEAAAHACMDSLPHPAEDGGKTGP